MSHDTHLEGRMRGINADRDGSFGSDGILQGTLRVLCNANIPSAVRPHAGCLVLAILILHRGEHGGSSEQYKGDNARCLFLLLCPVQYIVIVTRIAT